MVSGSMQAVLKPDWRVGSGSHLTSCSFDRAVLWTMDHGGCQADVKLWTGGRSVGVGIPVNS